MKTASAKAKGRLLQQWVRDRMLEIADDLEPDDIKSTSMGAGGEDVQLSPAARKAFPVSIECKSRVRFAVYRDYEQAFENSGGHEPVVVVKENRGKPLAIVDAEFFFRMVEGYHDG